MSELLDALDAFALSHDADITIERRAGRNTHHWGVLIAFGGTTVAHTMNASLREAVERALLDAGAL